MDLVNESNLSFLKSVEKSNQSNNEFQLIETKPEQSDHSYIIPVTGIAQLENESLPCYFSSLDSFYLDNYNDFEYYESESEEDITYDHGNESLNLEPYEVDEDVLILRQVRQLIENVRNLMEMFNFIKMKLYDWYEITKGKNVQILKVREPRLRNDFWYRFNTPYFKDRNLFNCWANADTAYREKHGLQLTTMLVRSKRNRWTISDRKILSDFIKGELIEKEIQRLQSEKIRLKREEVNNGNTKTCKVRDETKKFVLNKHIMEMDDKSGEINKQKLNKDKRKIDDISKVLNEIEIKTNIEMKSKDLTELMNGKDDWEFNWDKISIIGFNNKYSSNECAQYWHLYLKPSINKESWSTNEDDYLTNLVIKYKRQNWEKISEELGTNRSPYQVFIHYFGDIFKYQRKSELDYLPRVDNKELANIVKSCIIDGRIEWHSVSYLTGRPVKQLYNQWWYSSRPGIVKGKFTVEEDMIILTGFQELGYDSKMLSTILKHRNTSQILSRYKCLIPDGTLRGPWELHEDDLLIKLVKKYGFGEWSKIANEFPTRNRTQIRQRYSILQRKIKQDMNFNVAQLKRKKCRNVVNKSANVDKLVGKVKRKLKKYDFAVDKSSIKNELVNKLKRNLFPNVNYHHLSENKKSDRKLIDFFKENCHPYKHVRKSDVKNISNLAVNTLYSLVYLNVTTLKTITKADIDNDDRIDDLLRAVLLELMQGEIFDVQFVKQKLFKLECPGVKNDNADKCTDEMIVEYDSTDECTDEVIVEYDSTDECVDKVIVEFDCTEECTDQMVLENYFTGWEIDYSAPSTSKQIVYKRIKTNGKCNEYTSSVRKTIDCSPVKRKDSLIDLKEQWLSSEINFKDVKTSQLIHGMFDEFSFGVYKFIKKDSDCASQTMTDVIPLYSISYNTNLPETTPQLLQNCDSNFDQIYPKNSYKLPVNLSSLIFLRTLELSKMKLENNLKNENIIIKDLNDLTNIILQQNNPSIIPGKTSFNEKSNDPIMELPATKLLLKRICDVLHWTILTTKLPVDFENQPTEKFNRIEVQNKVSKFGKTRVKKTWVQNENKN